MNKYDTILFDMDGTLLDTLEDLKDSVNFTLASYGFPLKNLQEIRNSVGNGVSRLMELSLPDGRNNPHYEECLAEFYSHYSGNMQNKTEPFKGILEILKELSKGNYKIGIVSNKYDKAVKELAQTYFGEYIQVAIGESENVSKKPAPDSVFKALEELKSVPGRTLYVGDSEVDAETARNAGIGFVGVTWGYRDREILEQKGARCFIDKPGELLEVIHG